MSTKTRPADCRCDAVRAALPASDRPFAWCNPCHDAAMDRLAAELDAADAQRPTTTTEQARITRLHRVQSLEGTRHRARAAGQPTGALDAELIEARTHLAGALLGLSRERRDAGDHAGALEAAREYAHQQHLARSTQERLAREVAP